MAKKRDPQKAEQKDKCVSVNDLKEMKSSALSIRRKLDDTTIFRVQNVMEEYYALVDRFYQAHEHLMSLQQCRTAKHDFEYFVLLLDLAIHYSATSDKDGQSQEI